MGGLSAAHNSSAVGNRAAEVAKTEARNSRRGRPREQPDRRGDDCCGDSEHRAHHTERPGQWKRRAGRIVLRGIVLKGIGLHLGMPGFSS